MFLIFWGAINVCYASKARMLALGQSSDYGSFYIKDSRSIFLNPATINQQKNYFITELGSASSSDSNPNSEGGIIFDFADFVWGVYLGSEINANNSARTAANFLAKDNRVDFLFGGDAGFTWGARGHFAAGKDRQSAVDRSYSAVGIGLGVSIDKVDGYCNFDLQDVANGATIKDDKWETDLGMKLGVAYNFLGSTFFIDYEKNGFKSSVGDITHKSEQKINVGAGTTFQLDSVSKLFADLKYYSDTEKISGTADLELTEYGLPLCLGFETQIMPWLFLRASIKQSFIGGEENSSGDFKSFSNTTDVSTGITITVGKVNIDGMVGQDRDGNKQGSFGSVTNFSLAYKF
ncbi:MAG TPA: hypothetical protein VI754_15210 [Bacteriovoracaceae bacterium]|nr:hypothetical protein [Bacteriovoracaceae bacterium]